MVASTRFRVFFIVLVLVVICVLLLLQKTQLGSISLVSNAERKGVGSDHDPVSSTEEKEAKNDPLSSAEEKVQGDSCHKPSGGFKAWKQGVVTLVHPPVVKNCSKLFAGDRQEQKRVARAEDGWVSGWKEDDISRQTENCSWLEEYLRDNLYISERERSFPLAFSFVVYQSPEQFLRLFKLLYRPHNTYCIHYDKKSVYKSFFRNFADCLPNVIIPRKIIDVKWGQKTLLMAQMSCLSDLVSYREKQREEKRWQYAINLCGKELPLMSTRMMVEKLISMNQTSMIYSRRIPATERTMKRLKGKTLPYNLIFYKSMTFNALSISFVYFLLQNSTAIKTYNFFLNTGIPEEHFYATLFRMPGVPGGYKPHIQYLPVDQYIWKNTESNRKKPCHGSIVHDICIVNYADLLRVMKETRNGTSAFFQNKYFMELDHVVMDCMEERMVDINRREYALDCATNIHREKT